MGLGQGPGPCESGFLIWVPPTHIPKPSHGMRLLFHDTNDSERDYERRTLHITLYKTVITKMDEDALHAV